LAGRSAGLGDVVTGSVGWVAELICYPVKSCAGVRLAGGVLTAAGLEHDRGFMVVGGDGTFRSQRRDPRLALVRPEIDGGRLTLRAEGAGEVVVHEDAAAPRRPVTLFGDAYEGLDQGDEVAGWLTEVLGKPSRLVRVPPDHRRITDGLTPGTSGYADSSAVHVLSAASLADLNTRMAERGGRALPVDRFRPNVVVDGWTTPHREDDLRRISIGDAGLGYTKPAIRCAITMVDQATGTRSGPEPLRTLSTYRRADGGGVAFGVKFAVLRPGRLAVGDEVVVTSWADHPPAE
jgi:uncharacterized protein